MSSYILSSWKTLSGLDGEDDAGLEEVEGKVGI